MTETAQRASRRATPRVVSDAVWAAVALAVLAGTTAIAWDQRVPGWERAVFEVVNSRHGLPYAVVWPVMQLGNVLVVPACALIAVLCRRRRLAVALLVAGLPAYWLAKLVKAVVERPRPSGLLDDVVVRGPLVADQGFVSGHATVATVVVAVLLPYVPGRVRAGLLLLTVLVALARVHTGAHLPLDVVGGAALGVAVATAVHLVLGRPRAR